jgi:hypothetical protein
MLNKIIKTMNKTTSPKGGKRGCLCKDGTYDSKCCNGELQEQGVGSTVAQATSTINVIDNTRTIVRSNG